MFVGYGIVAPEYGWDDYKGIDVKGKAVVILAGDPPIPDPNDPSKLDPKMFLGPELSFYGRPGSKTDLAHAHGATAVITLQGGPAGRGIRSVRRERTRAPTGLSARDDDRARCLVVGPYRCDDFAELSEGRGVVHGFGAGSVGGARVRAVARLSTGGAEGDNFRDGAQSSSGDRVLQRSRKDRRQRPGAAQRIRDLFGALGPSGAPGRQHLSWRE